MSPHPPAYIGGALPKTAVLQVPVSHPQNQPEHQSLPEPKVQIHQDVSNRTTELLTFACSLGNDILLCTHCLNKLPTLEHACE